MANNQINKDRLIEKNQNFNICAWGIHTSMKILKWGKIGHICNFGQWRKGGNKILDSKSENGWFTADWGRAEHTQHVNFC